MNNGFDISMAFHEKYYDSLYGHIVKVLLKDGRVIEGIFSDEFYEDGAILISPIGSGVELVNISYIESMELSEND